MLIHGLPKPVAPGRVVVIGGAGFVGGAIVKRLRSAGVETLSIGRREVDLVAEEGAGKLAALLRDGDAVVASAAMAPCRDIAMMVANMMLTKTILAAVASVAVAHVVNISSDAVYGDETVPIGETMPAAPTTLHGAMHLAREIAFRSQATAPLAILRPTLIYGADDPHNGYGPNRFRRAALAGEDIVLFGEGEERRDHVRIADVAEVVVRVLMQRSEGVLNIATGDVETFRAIADLAIAAAPSASTIRTSPRVGPMPHNGYRAFDITALRTAFPDFEPVKLARGLQEAQRHG